MAKKSLLKTRSESLSYTIIGISCHLMDYRFVHLLNNGPGFDFIKEEDLKISITGQDHSNSFSFYSYNDEDQRNSFYLVSNFSQDFVLLPEFRHIDYILLVEGDLNKKKRDTLLNTIRSTPKVQTAFGIKIAEIKNAETFLADIEMHISGICHEIKSGNTNIYLNQKGGKSYV